MPEYVPADYSARDGWWHPSGLEMGQDSIMPDPVTHGGWLRKRFEERWMFDRHIQGWKVHLSVMPLECEPLFDLVSPILRQFKVYHKFLPFIKAWNHDTSRKNYEELSARKTQGEGKNCTIYPNDPEELEAIVFFLETRITAYRRKMKMYWSSKGRPGVHALMPFPGGTKGDMPIGSTGLVAVRYGCFQANTRRSKVYNPVTEHFEPDMRYKKPYPDFASNIPNEIIRLRQ